jgi:hypothetical protein
VEEEADLWQRHGCNWLSHVASQLFFRVEASSSSFIDERIDELSALSAVSQATYTRYADKVTNNMSNSPAQKLARATSNHKTGSDHGDADKKGETVVREIKQGVISR